MTSDYSRRDMVVLTPGLLKWWICNLKKLSLKCREHCSVAAEDLKGSSIGKPDELQ